MCIHFYSRQEDKLAVATAAAIFPAFQPFIDFCLCCLATSSSLLTQSTTFYILFCIVKQQLSSSFPTWWSCKSLIFVGMSLTKLPVLLSRILLKITTLQMSPFLVMMMIQFQHTRLSLDHQVQCLGKLFTTGGLSFPF